MTDKLKVAVVGVGSLGRHHARIYSDLPTADLVGVYDTDSAQAERIARRSRTTVFDSLESLAQAADAASVCVPTNNHFEVASHLMRHNVHLLVEKPIAASTEEAEAMVKAADDNHLLLQVGHVERFNPIMNYLEEILDRPGFIEAIRLAPFPPERGNALPRGTEVSVVLDLMIHDLEIILHLVRSEISEIHAIGVPVLSPSEDIANVRLCFDNGCVANVSASRISREQVRKIRVFQPNTYVSLDYGRQSGRVHRKLPKGIVSDRVPILKGEPLQNELRTFVECVTQHNEPVVSGRHASAALRLAVRICKQIRENPS